MSDHAPDICEHGLWRQQCGQCWTTAIYNMLDENVKLKKRNAKLEAALREALDGFDGAADGHGVNFYMYAEDIKKVLQEAGDELSHPEIKRAGKALLKVTKVGRLEPPEELE